MIQKMYNWVYGRVVLTYNWVYGRVVLTSQWSFLCIKVFSGLDMSLFLYSGHTSGEIRLHIKPVTRGHLNKYPNMTGVPSSQVHPDRCRLVTRYIPTGVTSSQVHPDRCHLITGTSRKVSPHHRYIPTGVTSSQVHPDRCHLVTGTSR